MAFAWIKNISSAFTGAAQTPPTLEEEKTRFFKAIRKGNIKTATEVLDKYPEDALAWKVKGIPPLQAAIDARKLEMFKFLAERGSNIDATYEDGWTPLLQSVLQNKKEFVDYLLDQGVRTDVVVITLDRSMGGWANPYDYGTALHIAAEKNYKDIVVSLLQHGASPDIKTEIGAHDQTPLDVAKWHDRKEIALYLTDAAKIRAQYLAKTEKAKEDAEKALNTTETGRHIKIGKPLRLKTPSASV